MNMNRFGQDHYPQGGGVRSYGFWWGQTCRDGTTIVHGRHWWARTSDSRCAAGTCVRIGFGDLSDADLIRVASDLDEDEVWVVLSGGDEFSSMPPAIAARTVFRAAEIVIRPREILFVDAAPPFRHVYARRVDRAAVPALFTI